MREARFRRTQHISRELSLAAFGLPLSQFDPWVIDRLTSVLEDRSFHSGDTVYAAGQPADAIYFMHSGRVQMARPDRAPWIFEGRWVLGGFDVQVDRPRSRTAIALDDFDALRVPAVPWIELLEDSFELTRRLITNQANYVAKLEAQAVNAGVVAVPRIRRAVPDRPLDAIERLAQLAQLATFREPGIQALVDLVATSEELRLEPGQSLDLERGASLFLVVDGEIAATRADGGVTRKFAAPQTVLGAAAFAPAGAAGWRAVASTRSRILSIPVETWYDAIEEHFELARSLLAMLADRRETLLELLAERSGPNGLVMR